MIDAEILKRLFHYDPATGIFTRLVYRSPNAKIGDIAGTMDKDGYWQIQIGPKIYKSHRLAFLYMTSEWPKGHVDHWDTDTGNNVWTNLRDAMPAQNAANCGPRPFNTSGLKGVGFDRRRGRWFAQIQIDRRCKHLGSFETPELASAAYLAAASSIYGEFARAL